MPTLDLKGAGAASQANLPQRRIDISAQKTEELEYALRGMLRDFESKQLKAKEDLWRKNQSAQEALDRKKLRAEEQAFQKDMRERDKLKRDEIRQQQQSIRDHKRQTERFWRDLGIGGLVGILGGQRGFAGLAGAAGGIAGGAAAGALGLSSAKAGIIAEIVKEVAELFVNPMKFAYAAAEPYFNYQRQSFTLGRAAGVPGGTMQREFYRGTPSTIPQWMQDIDLDPDQAYQLAMAFGIRPQGGMSNLLQTLGRTAKLGGFNYMDSNAVAGIARQGAAMGLTSPTGAGVQSYLVPFAQVVQEAVSKGMDQSQQVSSMQGSLEYLARSGTAAASPAAIADVIRQFAYVGTPGGLTGVTAQQAGIGALQSFQGFMGNGMLSAALFSALPKYGYLKTPGDVRKYVGEQQWAALQSGPGAAFSNKIVAQANAAAQAGNYQLALKLINDNLLGSDPRRMMEITAPFAKAMAGGREYALSTIYGGILPGMTPQAAAQLTYGGTAPERLAEGIGLYNGPKWQTVNPDYVNQVERVYASAFGGPASAEFDDKIGIAGYTKKLIVAGVPAKFASMFAAQGQRTGVNPMLLASVAARESGGNRLSDIGKYRKSSGGDIGIMQISPMNLAKYPQARGSDVANIAAGADILRWTLGRTGALTPSKVELPTDAVSARMLNWATGIQESQAAANTIVPIAKDVSTIRDTLIKILDKIGAFSPTPNLSAGNEGISWKTPGFKFPQPLPRPRPGAHTP